MRVFAQGRRKGDKKEDVLIESGTRIESIQNFSPIPVISLLQPHENHFYLFIYFREQGVVKAGMFSCP